MSADARVQIAIVILEDERRRVALQLRSDIEGIVNPGRWGLFGGHVEADEEPAAAALREVQEELSCTLEPARLRHFKREARNELDYHLFHYPVTDELEKAELTEGQRFGLFSPELIRAGVIEKHEVVDYHLRWLMQFWEQNGS